MVFSPFFSHGVMSMTAFVMLRSPVFSPLMKTCILSLIGPKSIYAPSAVPSHWKTALYVA